ncbi:MAG: hypothetical protein K5978_01645 [Campylobacter sp.]|nr:hypothetical protein [Campylobacter sp.]
MKVEIFRFNAKNDVLGFYKPYFFENCEFATLGDLLSEVKKQDPYFDYEGIKFARINGKVSSLDQSIAGLDDFKISPLNEHGAYKDLLYKNDDFMAVFELFKKFSKGSDRAVYKELEEYFYISDLRNYMSDYLGESSFIYGVYLCKKYPEKKEEISQIFLNDKNGFPYYDERFLNTNLAKDKLYEAVKYIKDNLSFARQQIAIKKEPQNEYKFSKFDDFKVAYYGKKAKISGLNFIEFDSEKPNGYEYLPLDKNLSYKLAGEILFDAYDNDADFILVNDENDFYMFDTLAKQAQKASGRELENFYVLRLDELSQIENSTLPKSLKKHKLRVLI